MRIQRSVAGGAASVALLGGACRLAVVKAAPARPTTTTSPSVRQAAFLKYAPPPGWIRHYLGDDRYKIDGKIWRVVSTQMDTYYHRPECPNMLKQPNGIVIGFPSGEDAVEAGYIPDPVCHPEVPDVAYAGGSPMSAPPIAVSSVPQAVTLSDGSTVTMPAGWQRISSIARSMNGMSFAVDTFKPGRGTGAVQVGSMTFASLPPNLDMARFLTPEGFKTYLQGDRSVLNTTGVVSSGLDTATKILDSLSVTAANIGGMRGVMLRPKRGARIPGLKGSVAMVGRGQKLYTVQDNTSGAPGADSFVRTFQPH